MGLYLGSSEKLKIRLGDSGLLSLYIHSSVPMVGDSRLLSSDNYILQDINGQYLTVKEDK